MKKNLSSRENLLAEIVHDHWATGPAADYARTAAAYARRRHRTKQLVVGATIAASMAVVLVFSVRHRLGPRSQSHAGTAVAPPNRGYEIISDAELLTELRDRSVLLVDRPNGRRELVLLDR